MSVNEREKKYITLAPAWKPDFTLVANVLTVSTAMAQTNENTTEPVAQLDAFIQSLRHVVPEQPSIVTLSGQHHNLLRQLG